MRKTSTLMTTAAVAVLMSCTSIYADSLRFWTTEEQPERLAKQQEMAAQFKAETGTDVEVIPVSENDLARARQPHLLLAICQM